LAHYSHTELTVAAGHGDTRRMEMQRMSGGSLRAAGYDERERKLVVELTAGTFQYAGVTPEVWRRFSTASSPWSYFRDNIEEEYPGKRIR
jgi:KTSC domain